MRVRPESVSLITRSCIMKTLCRSCAALAALVLVVAAARAADDDVPNINKRGDDEKKFAEKMATAIVKTARTSVKSASLEKFEKKNPKEGRTEWHIKADFKGAATGKAYTADMVVHIDTSDKDKWEVLRIDYSDDSKAIVGFNRKNVEAMVKKLNGK